MSTLPNKCSDISRSLQVNSISGPKKSFKDQGELKGVLADLGYTAEQVRFIWAAFPSWSIADSSFTSPAFALPFACPVACLFRPPSPSLTSLTGLQVLNSSRIEEEEEVQCLYKLSMSMPSRASRSARRTSHGPIACSNPLAGLSAELIADRQSLHSLLSYIAWLTSSCDLSTAHKFAAPVPKERASAEQLRRRSSRGGVGCRVIELTEIHRDKSKGELRDLNCAETLHCESNSSSHPRRSLNGLRGSLPSL